MRLVPLSCNPVTSLSRVVRNLGLVILLTACVQPCIFAQGTAYHYLKIVDNETPRPDDPSGQTFFEFYPSFTSSPTLDNGKLVFRTHGGNESIWVANVDGTVLTKLVDENTAAPGGTGKFNSMSCGFYGNVPVIKDGTIAFDATSAISGSDGTLHGIYSVPVAGGAVKRVADQNTVVPGGDGGTFFDPGSTTESNGDFTISKGKVAFLDDGGGTSGVYVANIDGTALTAVADGNHSFSFTSNGSTVQGSEFGGAVAILNGTVYFYGQSSDASSGYNTLIDSTGNFSYHKLIGSDTKLPGNTNASPHTRFDVPPLAFDGTRIAFVADDANSAGSSAHFSGLYTLPVAGGALTKIADNKSTPPGLDAGTTYTFSDAALDNGLIAFGVYDGNENTGIYVTKADGTGTIQRIAGTGDALVGGQVVSSVGLVAGGFSGGKIGVTVTYDFGHANGGDTGLYVLSNDAIAPVITSASTATATVGKTFSYQITAENDPTGYGVTGLPPGLTVNRTTGLISGTPEKAGTVMMTMTARNTAGAGSAGLTLTIKGVKPVITSAGTAPATEGSPFSYQITASNSPTSYGVLGLPPGLKVDGKTGLISGSPTVSGQKSLTLKATNTGGTGEKTLVLTIAQATPAITSATTATATVGKAFSYQIIATNHPTSYGVVGLPPGLHVDGKTGLISGTPTASGKKSLTLKAANAAGIGKKIAHPDDRHVIGRALSHGVRMVGGR